MISVLIGIGTFLLIIVAVLLIGAVLLQRAQSDSGMAAMGGGMVESAFGPDTSNVLSKFTIRTTVVFFILSFLLYLGYVRIRSHGSNPRGSLPNISASAALPSLPGGNPAPAAAQPAAPAVSARPAPDVATTTTTSAAKSKTP
jgi:preprotein translocase subunit SecG